MAKQWIKCRFAGFGAHGIGYDRPDDADRSFYITVVLFAATGFDAVTGLYTLILAIADGVCPWRQPQSKFGFLFNGFLRNGDRSTT